jgi:hypothetical protein
MIRSWLKRALLLDVYAELAAARMQVTVLGEQLAKTEARHGAERASWVTEREGLLLRLLGSPPRERNDRSTTRDGDVAVDAPRGASPIARKQVAIQQRLLEELRQRQAAIQIGEPSAEQGEIAETYLRQQASNGAGEWNNKQAS